MGQGVHDGHRERLRQRFIAEGLENFQPHEVLELMLFYAIPRRNTSELAHRLINHFGDFAAVLEAPVKALMQVEGISTQSAVLISMFSQVLRRYQLEKDKPPTILDTSEKLGKILIPKLSHLQNEVVMMLCLDGKFKLLDCSVLTEGTMNSIDLTLRTILQRALLVNASIVVLAHNHPSELAIPSKTDIATTIQLMRSLKTVDIDLWDHIVVAGNDMVSMRDSEKWKNLFPQRAEIED